MSQKSEDLNYLFHLTEWGSLIEIEKKFRDDSIFEMMRVSLDDPNYATKMAYHRGLAESIPKLWGLRDSLRKAAKSVKTIKEGKNAESDETSEADD